MFFDLDYTLLDHSAKRETLFTVCQQISAQEKSLDAELLLRTNGDVWSTYWPEVQEDWDLGRTDSVTVSREAWRRSLLLCGCDSIVVIESAVRIHLQEERKKFRLFADVSDTLDILMNAGLDMALITNGPSDSQRTKLEILEVDRWFSTIVISGEVGIAKPDASIFAMAMRKMDVQPKDVWHIGDNPDTDVAGARAAGLTAVWLNREGIARKESDPEPHFEIGTLASLPGILRLG